MLQNVLAYLLGLVTEFISSVGYVGVAVCMALESCNIPLPSEMIQPFAGYLIATGRFSFIPAVLAGTIGGTIGSIISYVIGYYAIDSRLLFWIPGSRKEQLHDWFARHGDSTAFFARLLPGIRTFISLPAGAAKMNLVKFIIYTFSGSLIWSVLLTYSGFIMGVNWEQLRVYFERLDILILIGILGIAAYYFLHRWYYSKH
ncbi:MAG: DedA family protein [Syntrophomonadaceae bacterium]